MSLLVTGANGFLGRCLVAQLLADGHPVRAFCRHPPPPWEQGPVEVVLGDIRDPQAIANACAGIDTVFHTAAVAGVWGPWRHYYDTNTRGTEHLLAACRQHGVRRLVYTSSPSVTFDASRDYGVDQLGVDESAPYPPRWLCHYPHTKALAEQQVLSANGHGTLLTCALRPHLIWGLGDRHLIPRLIARRRAGQLRRVGDGTNLIDIVYVDNAAQAHRQAAAALVPGSPVCGQAYFISQGEPVNCWSWIDQLLALAGLPPVRKSISLKAAWRIGAGLEAAHRLLRIQSEPRMTRFLAAQLGRSHYFNIGRARRDFGYQPQVSIEEGMRRLAASGFALPDPR